MSEPIASTLEFKDAKVFPHMGKYPICVFHEDRIQFSAVIALNTITVADLKKIVEEYENWLKTQSVKPDGM